MLIEEIAVFLEFCPVSKKRRVFASKTSVNECSYKIAFQYGCKTMLDARLDGQISNFNTDKTV